MLSSKQVMRAAEEKETNDRSRSRSHDSTSSLSRAVAIATSPSDNTHVSSLTSESLSACSHQPIYASSCDRDWYRRIFLCALGLFARACLDGGCGATFISKPALTWARGSSGTRRDAPASELAGNPICDTAMSECVSERVSEWENAL